MTRTVSSIFPIGVPCVMQWIKPFCQFLLVTAVFSLTACGETDTEPVPQTGPLTVETWRTLPVSEKYDESSFQRLKENDPKLKSDRAWDKFMREVVIPERKKDIPGTPGEPVDQI